MKGQTNPNILKPRLQRRLRKSMTDAERQLWRSLQRKQLDGLKFRRQHPFGNYIIDFVCLQAGLAVEVDGGQHADSSTDLQRTAFLNSAGYLVLRFGNNDVLSNTHGVLEEIARTLSLSSRGRNPSP